MDGTAVTIGTPGNVVAAIGLENRYVGGLLLIDREQYFAMKERLERDGMDAVLQGAGQRAAAGKKEGL